MQYSICYLNFTSLYPCYKNFLPVCSLERFELQGDLFISLGALSESSEYSQKYVIDNKWFGAKNIFLNFQNEDDRTFNAKRIKEYIKDKFKVVGIENLDNQSYAFGEIK